MAVNLRRSKLKVIVDNRDIFSNILYLLHDTIVRHSSTPWRIVADTCRRGTKQKINYLRTNDKYEKTGGLTICWA